MPYVCAKGPHGAHRQDCHGFEGALTHDVIHGLDVTVPLGIGRHVPEERLRIVIVSLLAGISKDSCAFNYIHRACVRALPRLRKERPMGRWAPLPRTRCPIPLGPRSSVLFANPWSPSSPQPRLTNCVVTRPVRRPAGHQTGTGGAPARSG